MIKNNQCKKMLHIYIIFFSLPSYVGFVLLGHVPSRDPRWRDDSALYHIPLRKSEIVSVKR